MTAVLEKHPQKVINLCKALRKGPVPVSKLSSELTDYDVLGYAFASGLIQVGRQMYSLVIVGEPKIVKDKNNKPVLDENRRPVLDKQYAAKPDNEWSWMKHTDFSRKPLNEVLEEELPEGVEMHVRITNEGLAATL
jgi:hypothetical protein